MARLIVTVLRPTLVISRAGSPGPRGPRGYSGADGHEVRVVAASDDQPEVNIGFGYEGSMVVMYINSLKQEPDSAVVVGPLLVLQSDLLIRTGDVLTFNIYPTSP